MVVLHIASLISIGVPVVAARADADDAALTIVSRIFPCYDSAIAAYKNMLAYMGIEDKGIFTAAGEENGSDAKLAEIRACAKAL